MCLKYLHFSCQIHYVCFTDGSPWMVLYNMAVHKHLQGHHDWRWPQPDHLKHESITSFLEQKLANYVPSRLTGVSQKTNTMAK